MGEQELQRRWQQVSAELLHYRNIIAYYDSGGLRNIDVLKQTADLQLQNGEISFTDWVVLSNQAIGARSHYFEMLRGYNNAVIELLYLSSN